MDDKFFEDSFKKELFHYEEKPDADTWTSIEARLANPKSPSRRPFYYVLSAAAALVLVLSYFAIQYSGKDQRITTSDSAQAEPAEQVTSPYETPTRSGNTSERPEDQKGATHGNAEPIDRSRVADAVDDSGTDTSVKAATPQPIPGHGDPAKRRAETAWQNEEEDDRSASQVMEDDTPIQSKEIVSDHRHPDGNISGVNNEKDSIREETASNRSIAAAEEKKKRNIAPTDILFSAGPLLSYHQFAGNPDDAVYLKEIGRNNAISDRLGWSARGGAAWKLSPKLKLFTGVHYQHALYDGSFTSLAYENGEVEYDEKSGAIMITPLETEELLSYAQTRKEIGVAILAAYQLQADRLSHSLGVGVQVNRYRSRETFGAELPHASNGYTSYLQVSYNLEYSLTRDTYLLIQPQYSWEIGNRNRKPTVFNKALTQYVGLQLGLGVKLSRN